MPSDVHVVTRGGHHYIVDDKDESYCVHGNVADGDEECEDCEDDKDYYELVNDY